MKSKHSGQTAVTAAICFTAIFIGIFILHFFTGYWFESVSSKEVGIKMHAGQPFDVVGPGNYTDFTPFADLQQINVSEIPFTVDDPEVLTHDLQRVGVFASGTVRRPSKDRADLLMTNWARYSVYYTSDDDLAGVDAGVKDKPQKVGLMDNLGGQAIKVCVGDLNFSDAVVGSARDVLRECVERELNTLAIGYGLTVKNVVVPNVKISEAVQKSVDAITQARFDQQVAEQQKLTAAAQADNALAVAAGAIRVEQGKIQEQARQDAITADLNQKTLVAQNSVLLQTKTNERDVLERQKSNELYAAEQNKAIQAANADAAAAAARASKADEAALAAIYQANPAYANQKAVEAQSAAFKNTDKVVVPAGTQPNIIIGNGTQPVVQTPAR